MKGAIPQFMVRLFPHSASLLDELGLRVFRGQSMQDPLRALYASYTEKVRRKEIVPGQELINANIFQAFRRKSGGKLTGAQESYLTELLRSRSKRLFVPYVLNAVDYFSINLLHQLVDTALKVRNVSQMGIFLEPAIRVFDLRVDLEFQDRFHKSDAEIKKRILDAFAWIDARKVSKEGIDIPVAIYDTGYAWSRSACRIRSRKNPTDFVNYMRSIDYVRSGRIKLLLAEFFKSSTLDLRTSLSGLLPDQLAEFPPELRRQAKAYLGLNKTI